MFKDGAYNTFVEGNGMQLKTLNEIIKECGIDQIDFLTIDVEGMDLEVLETHDWSIKPTVIAIEASLGSPTQSLLEGKGYKFVGKAGLTLIFRLN